MQQSVSLLGVLVARQQSTCMQQLILASCGYRQNPRAQHSQHHCDSVSWQTLAPKLKLTCGLGKI